MSHIALYFSPSMLTARYLNRSTKRSARQISAFHQNFETNEYKGRVSRHTAAKIRRAIQWLVFLAPLKDVTCPETKKVYRYRAGLATVSLPSGTDHVTPQFFRKVLLPALLSACRYKFNLTNFVWKIERQKNGRLHAHITIDKFLPHAWLNKTWNEVLKRHGLLEFYHDFFSNMNKQAYINHRLSNDHKAHKQRFPSHLAYIKSLIKAYEKGQSSNWYRPNTTDIHSVKKVKNLAAYMVKYLSKDPNLGDDWKGRFWACSHGLSKLRSTVIHLPESELKRFSEVIAPSVRTQEELFFFIDNGRDVVDYGVMFFFHRKLSAITQCKPLRDLRELIQRFYHQCRLPDLPHLKFQWTNGSFNLVTFNQTF